MRDEAGRDGITAQNRGGCGFKQPEYKRDMYKLQVNFPDSMEDIPGTGDRKQNLSAKKVHEILSAISEEDIIALGFHPKHSRPSWMLHTVVPVPPPHVRPSVQVGAGRSEDDLTHQLATIIKCNNTLRVNIQKGEAPHIIQEVRRRPGSRGGRGKGGRGGRGVICWCMLVVRGCVGGGGWGWVRG